MLLLFVCCCCCCAAPDAVALGSAPATLVASVVDVRVDADAVVKIKTPPKNRRRSVATMSINSQMPPGKHESLGDS